MSEVIKELASILDDCRVKLRVGVESQLPQVSHHISAQDAAKQILEALEKATKVVAWYDHPSEVRGPFGRWLTVENVPDEYKKNVGTNHDDAKYAALCMNFAPMLALQIQALQAEVNQCHDDIKELRAENEVYAQFAENFGDLSCCYDAKDVCQLMSRKINEREGRLKSALEKMSISHTCNCNTRKCDDSCSVKIRDEALARGES